MPGCWSWCTMTWRCKRKFWARNYSLTLRTHEKCECGLWLLVWCQQSPDPSNVVLVVNCRRIEVRWVELIWPESTECAQLSFVVKLEIASCSPKMKRRTTIFVVCKRNSTEQLTWQSLVFATKPRTSNQMPLTHLPAGVCKIESQFQKSPTRTMCLCGPQSE